MDKLNDIPMGAEPDPAPTRAPDRYRPMDALVCQPATEPRSYAAMLSQLCESVAGGASLSDFWAARQFGLQWLMDWVECAPHRVSALQRAQVTRRQAVGDSLTAEALALARSPIETRTDGKLNGDGISPRDKVAALALVGPEFGLFTKRQDVAVTVSIGAVLDRARARVAARRTDTLGADVQGNAPVTEHAPSPTDSGQNFNETTNRGRGEGISGAVTHTHSPSANILVDSDNGDPDNGGGRVVDAL